jgi:uncharacterized lipoprotein YmbA
MRAQIVAVVAVVVLTVGLGACAPFKRTPEARFYVLRSLVEPPAAPAPTAAGGLVGILPVRLPGYLDRPQLVTEMATEQVRVDEYARWAEPLPAAVTRTLAENLAILLPESRVVRYPWPAGESMRCRVSVELRALAAQCGSRAGGPCCRTTRKRHSCFVPPACGEARSPSDRGASIRPPASRP